jgi:hypothetical protein
MFLIVVFHVKHPVLAAETKEVAPIQSPRVDLFRVLDLRGSSVQETCHFSCTALLGCADVRQAML